MMRYVPGFFQVAKQVRQMLTNSQTAQTNHLKSMFSSLDIPREHRVTSITPEEGEFIHEFLHLRKIGKTLETGFAYGASTVCIMAATHCPHIAIDPYQRTYSNLGLHNIEKLGLSQRLKHIELPSHLALPKLLSVSVTIDFGFIDGGHLFDEIFLDWYYIDKLLNLDGCIMFHDRWLASTQAVASFIRANRKDYDEVSHSMKNLYVFQKKGRDKRHWKEFSQF